MEKSSPSPRIETGNNQSLKSGRDSEKSPQFLCVNGRMTKSFY